jgi:hypothetical protein
MTTPGKPAFGGTVLRLPAIQSPNYAAGSDGWIIRQDGGAEFNSITIRGTTILSGSAGVFVYSGTPGPGNPPTGWVTSAAADPFGNALPVAGNGQQDVNGYVAMLGSVLLMAVTGQASALAGVIQASGPGEADVFSPLQTGGDVRAALSLKSKASNGGLGPVVSVFNGAAFNSAAGTPANPTQVTTDGWHVVGAAGEPAYAANFGASAGDQAPRFRLEADLTVVLDGTAVTTAATGAVAAIFTLPAGYRPAQRKRFAGVTSVSGYVTPGQTLINITGGGVVSLIPAAGAAGQQVVFDGMRFPVD